MFKAGSDADQRDFRLLYDEVFPVLFRVALRIAGREDAAEDLVHDSLMKLWEKRLAFPNRDEAKYWLIRVVKNAALNHAKRSGRERRAYERVLREVGPPSESGEKRLLEEEAGRDVVRALDKLPQPLKETLVLKEYGELNYREIGRVLGITETNVKVRVFRAREKLQAILAEDGHVS